MSTKQGIFHFSELNDFDKSYLVKLIGTMLASIVAGIITGIVYDPEGGSATGLIGFGIWFLVTLGLTFYIKAAYDLANMSNLRIFRHGVFIGFLTYIYLWVVIFNFIVESKFNFVE